MCACSAQLQPHRRMPNVCPPEVKPEALDEARAWAERLRERGIKPPYTFIVHPAGLVR